MLYLHSVMRIYSECSIYYANEVSNGANVFQKIIGPMNKKQSTNNMLGSYKKLNRLPPVSQDYIL